MSEQKDIFDKIMSLPGLRRFYGLYARYKEILLYILFGGVSTVVSIGSFVICESALGMDALIANVISWILAVSTAYATNRTWVFGSTAKGKAFWKEMASFFSGRVATLVMEEAILLICVTWLGMPAGWVKLAAQIAVLVGNYFLSKLIIFKKK
ncbi:MAG: GtrA family protein [Oscillospiraceae bacterium]|nr:GtrA family protein [Oscillospiraceae bacterium]